MRPGHRGTGIAHHLVDGAVEFARAHGAPAIEGYPVDTGGERARTNDLFHGTLGTFVAAGFEQQTEMKPGRVLVTLPVAG